MGTGQELRGEAMELLPGAHVISPRGDVSEMGMNRFFRRTGEGVYDMDDLAQRTEAMAGFVADAKARTGAERVIGFGYSNGANIAAAVMMQQPEIFQKAILLRPMLPLQNPPLPDLEGKKILILQGRHDSVIPAESTRQLSGLLQKAGAEVTTISMEAGHELSAQDLEACSRWLSGASIQEPVEAV